jgi:hypothetical protein
MEAGRRNETVTVLFFWSREIIGKFTFASDRRFLRGFDWDRFGIMIAATKTHITLVDLQALTGITKLMAFQRHKDIHSAASCLYSES